MGHSGGGAHRALRVPRALLQWAAAAFGARVSQPPGLRATVGSRSIGSLTQVSTKSGQVHTSAVIRSPALTPWAWRRATGDGYSLDGIESSITSVFVTGSVFLATALSSGAATNVRFRR